METAVMILIEDPELSNCGEKIPGATDYVAVHTARSQALSKAKTNSPRLHTLSLGWFVVR